MIGNKFMVAFGENQKKYRKPFQRIQVLHSILRISSKQKSRIGNVKGINMKW